MPRPKIVAHDYSLRGHVQRQCLFTPLLGVNAIKKKKYWQKSYEIIADRYRKWVFRMRTAWPTTETVMQMQMCFPPASLIAGRKLHSCRRARFCPWCHARQTAQLFDLLCHTPVPEDHVVIGFRHAWKLTAKDNAKMTPDLKKDCVRALAAWIGSFRASSFHKDLPAHGAVLNHTLICTSDYNVAVRRVGVAIVHKSQSEIWTAWQNEENQRRSERRAVRVYEDTTKKSIAKACVFAFKYPKYIFTITPENLALLLALPKRYRFVRKTGACYSSNPGLKEET